MFTGKYSELSNFAKKYFPWPHSSVLQDNLIGLAKIKKKNMHKWKQTEQTEAHVQAVKT